MPTPITMPEAGESVVSGILSSWLKDDGDHVERDETVAEVETDKITVELLAPAAGVLKRTVSEGDEIEIGQSVGEVDEISLRLTRVITRDGIAILVPNSELVSTKVTNITRPTDVYRTRIDIGVAYGSDLEAVRTCLLEVAKAHELVLDDPKPEVFFVGFGDSSLDFQLCVWVDDPQREPRIASDLRFGIDAGFRRDGITIPFPQRDLHLVA